MLVRVGRGGRGCGQAAVGGRGSGVSRPAPSRPLPVVCPPFLPSVAPPCLSLSLSTSHSLSGLTRGLRASLPRSDRSRRWQTPLPRLELTLVWASPPARPLTPVPRPTSEPRVGRSPRADGDGASRGCSRRWAHLGPRSGKKRSRPAERTFYRKRGATTSPWPSSVRLRVPNSPPSSGGSTGGSMSPPPPAAAGWSARGFGLASNPVRLRTWQPHGKKKNTTLSGGSLGSCVDEERS